MTKIYLAIPSADGKIDIGLARWILANKEHEAPGDPTHICTQIDFSQVKPLESNMKFIFVKFLESDCDYLLWIDNDVTPYDGFVTNALKSNPDIYGGRVLFWQPQFEGPMVVAAVKEVDKYRYVSIVGPHERPSDVDFVGFGCVLIRREVIDLLMSEFNDILFSKEYWPTGHVKKGLDVLFCELAKEMKFNVQLDNGEIMDQTVTLGLKYVAEKYSNIIYKCMVKKNSD